MWKAHKRLPQLLLLTTTARAFGRIKIWEARNQSQPIPERKKAEFRRTFDGMRPKLAKALAAETLVKERVAKGTWDYKVNAQSSAGAKGKCTMLVNGGSFMGLCASPRAPRQPCAVLGACDEGVDAINKRD